MHAVPDFPISVPVMITWIVLLILAVGLFVQILVHLSRKGHRHVIGGIFIALLLTATVVHVILLSRSTHTVTDGNWVQLVMISFFASLEMFIGHTVVFDDIIAAVIFREPLLLMVYATVFTLIIAFTLSILLLIVPRRLRDRSWLIINARKAKKAQRNYIFLGLNNRSKTMAKAILAEKTAKKEPGEVILVDFPQDGGEHKEISIGELFSNIFGRAKELSLEDQLGSFDFVLLRGSQPDGAPSLCPAIGLKDLQPWIENPSTRLYLLSEDEEENLALLKLLATDNRVKAKIFCYSNRKNSYASLMAAMGDRIRLLNPPEMILAEIKQNHPELHPIHFVDIARDADGQPLGYVKQANSAMIIGFNEIGQEALRYLFEFGSFIGKDKQPLQNNYYVYDPEINALKGDFLNRTPALRYAASINWSEESVGSSKFWMEYAMMLPTLNYVIISIDQGRENVEIAIRLLKEAARYGKDLTKLCILVRAGDADAQMLEMIDFYNRSFCPEGCAVIHPMGQRSKLWNPELISGKQLKQEAIRRSLYSQNDNWEIRSKVLRSRGGNQLLNRQELLRRQAQDINSGLYAPTLRQLCPESLYPVLEQIPDTIDPARPVHFTGSADEGERLEYLARAEQLHWMSALQAAGYIDGGDIQDELNMKIRHLVIYDEVPDEEQRHICWRAVKTILL